MIGLPGFTSTAMRKEQPDKIDANTPALIVRCGATRRKCRPLVNDVLLLGRAPGCDIGLVSPEVAPVHCVIVRVAQGWRIRDCSGRSTQLNGKSITDEPLRDGDILQVGTFSFEAHLPVSAILPAARPAAVQPVVPAVAQAPAPAPANANVERLQQSRRRLAELAMTLRRKLRDQAGGRNDLAQQQMELEQMERRLRKAHEEQMARQAKVAEQTQRLEARSAELDAYSRHLRRMADQLRTEQEEQAQLAELDKAGFEADLIQQRVELNEDRRRLMDWQHDLQARQAELEGMGGQVEQALSGEREQLDRDREQLLREREYLDQERRELLRERAELEQVRQNPGETPTPAAPAQKDTKYDPNPPDRLESARKLLRQLSERRKALADSVAPVSTSSRTNVPVVDGSR